VPQWRGGRIVLVGRGAIMLLNHYHLATRKFPSMRRNVHLLFAFFGLGQSKHLLSEQVAHSLKRTCRGVGADGQGWLAPAPLGKQNYSTPDNLVKYCGSGTTTGGTPGVLYKPGEGTSDCAIIDPVNQTDKVKDG